MQSFNPGAVFGQKLNTLNMLRFFVALLLATSTAGIFAQKPQPVPGLPCTRIDLPFAGNDTARILLEGKPESLSRKKAVFLFVHGSLPTPLCLFQDSLAYGVFPFHADEFQEQYHFVTVAKPGLPFSAQISELDPNMCYLDRATQLPPDAFRRNNYLDYYVKQYTAVLDWLLQQPWVDPSRVVICGGSQGATVASKVASVHPGVTHLIYYSGNPNGRLDEEVRRVQRDLATGDIKGAEAGRKLEGIQQYWQWLYAHPDETGNPENGDSPKTTVSFSSPAREWLVKLNIPVLVAFGTADITAAPCATLPLDFLRAGKQNLTLKIYPDYDHHFFEKMADGSEPQYRMDAAFREWMAWVK